MKYFKLKKVVTDTTFSLVTDENETSVMYSEEENFQYFGVETTDKNFLNKQYKECEVEELTFEQISPVLQRCKLLKDLNEIVEIRIAERYSIGAEINMLKLDVLDEKRIEYQNFVDGIKNEVDVLKVEYGLKYQAV